MINLHYIRAAVQADTGVRLSLRRTRELLVEEGLITQAEADRDAQLFIDYRQFYENEDVSAVETVDTEEGLPD